MALAIQTQHLTKSFRTGFWLKETLSLSDLNLEVEEGRIFGFLGHNGAGKTTTIKLLIGVLYPTSGDALIFGKSISEIAVKREIGFLPESPYFYDYLTGFEFLDFCGQLFGMGQKERSRRITALFELVHLQGAEKEQLRKYSKGMLQRIGLAQALINDPKLVILDEPMSGLDPIGRKDVRDIIVRLREEGKTVFFSTHVLSDAEMICDEVGIIIKGRLRNKGKLEEMLNPKLRSIEVCLTGLSREKETSLKAFSERLTIRGQELYLTLDNQETLAKLIHWTEQQGGEIVSIVPRKESLEDIFMEEMKGARQ
ncbi:MAG: ABC transporter ATP-binding protein [Nitrospirae bacterium]|nr:ABC transporter ATP-binding protein [Candidatus Manganitrophaceae bacterium]